MRRLLLLAVLAVLVGGCSESIGEGKKEIVPLDKVPPVVMKAAQDKLPEIRFDSALKSSKGFYEVRGKGKNGKIQEVEVSEAGEVLAVE
jgi:PBP1b-binding outer membrane lipoprotein LpoB